MASATQHDHSAMAVIDSGLGGISVVRALRDASPGIPLIYAADTAGFPYGGRSAGEITARGISLTKMLHKQHGIRRVVVACNTLSTLSLAALRAAFPEITFIGTVPAIKVAAAQSVTKRFTLLATPNTAHSPYSKSLIDEFASGCVVDCYGAPNLAAMAEAVLLGDNASEKDWKQEIAPCFHNDARGRTDQVILGCTHYPLILPELMRHAPWQVEWIDSSAAIARQALRDHENANSESLAYVTKDDDVARYKNMFAREGFNATASLSLTPGAASEAASA